MSLWAGSPASRRTRSSASSSTASPASRWTSSGMLGSEEIVIVRGRHACRLSFRWYRNPTFKVDTCTNVFLRCSTLLQNGQKPLVIFSSELTDPMPFLHQCKGKHKGLWHNRRNQERNLEGFRGNERISGRRLFMSTQERTNLRGFYLISPSQGSTKVQ